MNKDRGIIISDPEVIKKALSEFGENAPDWPFREEKKDADLVAQIFKNDLVDPFLHLHRTQMPDVIIGFDDLGNQNVLGQYRKVPNAHGLPHEVLLNSVHYELENGVMAWKWGKWSRDEVIAHEMGHGLLNFIAKVEDRKIPAHGKEFTELLEGWGLHPLPNHGAHFQVADPDKKFGLIMKQLCRVRPDDVPSEEIGKRYWFKPKKEPGKSTLHKWGCKCGQHARIGTKEYYARCEKPDGCGEVFVLLDGKEHNIYKSK